MIARKDGDLKQALDQEHSTGGYSFDELAKGIASGTISRGQALKLLGGAILGALFASIAISKMAQAAGNGCGGNLPTTPCSLGTSQQQCCIDGQATCNAASGLCTCPPRQEVCCHTEPGSDLICGCCAAGTTCVNGTCVPAKHKKKHRHHHHH